MVDIAAVDDFVWNEVAEGFEGLEVLARGESKDIRILDDDHVIVRLLPTLYSFSSNRSAIVAGTDIARLRSFEILNSVLRDAGIRTTAVHFGADFYIAERMKLAGRDYCPPLEVVVKGRHVGTPKHALYRIEQYPTLHGCPLAADKPHAPYVRFDYTNPLHDAEGNRLRDECVPAGLASRFMDTDKAERTALIAFETLFVFLSARGIRLDDICFKIDHTGRRIFGEISPDCMRAVSVGAEEDFFAQAGSDTSKDSFRRGASLDDTLARYRHFVDLISGPPTRSPVPVFAEAGAAGARISASRPG